jgi:hypothetical protein
VVDQKLLTEQSVQVLDLVSPLLVRTNLVLREEKRLAGVEAAEVPVVRSLR